MREGTKDGAIICTCSLAETMSTELAILTLECPVHDGKSGDEVHIDPVKGLSTLATEDVTAPSYDELSNSRKLKDEFGRYYDMFKLIIPLSLVGFLSHIPTVITSVLCGQLNSTTSQSAASLAMSTSNYAGFSLILGLLTAYESLGSQAYGAGRRAHLGLLTARSIMICLVLSCFVVVAWFYCEYFFDFITTTKKLVDYEAGGMLRMYSLALPFYCIDTVLTKYMIIVGLAIEAVYLRMLSVILHLTLSFIFIFSMDLELSGAGIALSMSEILTTIATVLVIRVNKLDGDIWSNVGIEVFKGWGKISWLGSAGAVMIMSQSLSIEASILLISKSDIDDYDAFLQLIQYHQFFFHLYHGFTVAGAIITGKNLGAQDPGKAKRDANYFCGFSAVAGVTFAIFSFLFRYQIAYLLSESTAVEEILKRFIPLYCLYVFVDCSQVSISGVIRGMGKQVIGALIYFVCIGVIGTIIAYYLIGVLGLCGFGAWISMSIGSVGALIGLLGVIYRTDWVGETNKALEKLGLIKTENIKMEVLKKSEHGSQRDHQESDTQLLDTDNESVPLFARTQNTVTLEAKLMILLTLSSFCFMILAIALHFIL